MEREKDRERITQFVRDNVMPEIKKAEIYPSVFLKNGTFSDKYQFNLCKSIVDEARIVSNFIDINYDALSLGADGVTEICVRELIPYNANTTPCIYNGLPLRPEFRVFYDFDRHQPLYIVNYWDWDYCHDTICRNYTDKIVYESYYPKLIEQYDKHKDAVMEMTASDMKFVTGLDGIWSIDVMFCEPLEYQHEYEGFWLIDMAVGSRSAYWNPDMLVKIYENM